MILTYSQLIFIISEFLVMFNRQFKILNLGNIYIDLNFDESSSKY